MKDKLEKLHSEESLPASHKKSVLKVISTAMLVGNIAELFTRDYAMTSGSLIAGDDEQQSDEENKIDQQQDEDA